MIFVNQIPHLKVYRQRAIFPIDDKIQSMYSLAIVNTASQDASIKLMTHPKVSDNGRFHSYFIDSMYNGSFFGHNYRLNKTRDRADLYTLIEEKQASMNTATTLSSVSNRNLFFDMLYLNEIFFDLSRKALNYRKKAEEYLKVVSGIFKDTRFETYKQKIMLIDIDSWVGDIRSKLKTNKFYDNPIFILYYAMAKDFNAFKELGNIDLIFYNEVGSLRLNPSLCDKQSYNTLQLELKKLSPSVTFLTDNEEELDENIERKEVQQAAQQALSNHFSFTGADDKEAKEIEKKIDAKAEELTQVKTDKDKKEKVEDLTTELANNEDLMREITSITLSNTEGKSNFSSKRDEVLRERQKELKIGSMTLDEMQKINNRQASIDHSDVSSKVRTTNSNVTKIRYPNFNKVYNDKLMRQDTMNILTSLNEKSIPVFIRDIKIEDSSDELNYKETYTVMLEDGNRVRHTLKFDMPKFIDDRFMYLNGNKKMIVNQFMMKPITKTGPDEVQIVSNYNKIFIRRYGQKMSSKIEKFRKAVAATQASSSLTVKYGSTTKDNHKYITVIEYDELAKDFTSIKVKGTEILFNQKDVEERLVKSGKKLKDTEMCVGFTGQTPVVMDLNTQRIGELDIVDYILSLDSNGLKNAFDDATAGKKFVYSRATIMAKDVPVILLLGYLEGLSGVMRKASIKHYFTDKRPRDLTEDQGVVQFNNGYLVYEKYPFENSLLMQGFADIPTKGFDYEEFDSKDVYLTIFDVMFGSKIIGNAFDNFYELMIDPITKEVLEDLNYPTDFVNVMLFANAMLADNSYIQENNMNLYRIRSNELVNAYLYKAIATAYINYRLTSNNNNPVKISLPQDAVTKQLLMAQTVEDYSTLNPIVELEKARAITPKGPSGLNLDQAYTQDKRAYSRTMTGIVAMSTSPDANVGVVRQLSMEPNIRNARGYLDIEPDDSSYKNVHDANLFSPAEMLSPLGITRDDTIRSAMATKQSKHIIPVKKSSPVLISNGVEQTIPYHLSNDFSIVAKGDGEVIEVDESTGVVVVGYYSGAKKDGKPVFASHQAIDTSPRVVKNGAGGFYLSNKLVCEMKKGQKFKKDDVLASDEKFFTRSKVDGTRFNIGSLQKIACMSSYSTYEDSTFITSKLGDDMMAEMIMEKSISLGKNANVDYIVKIGDEVKVGDELLRFETSFEDDSLNKFLDSIGENLQEEIKSLGKTPVKSKYNGVIEDIRVYSTVDLKELSPSLQKIVSSYYNRVNKKKNLIAKYDKTPGTYKLGILLNEPSTKIETKDGKVKGTEVGEGVLIEIFIKYQDIMGVGDKITFFTALKSIVGEIIPKGYEPYALSRPEEEISSFVAPGAVLARMTPSILLTMFGNKVLVELKRTLHGIYHGKPWTPTE